jgi:hypothetical protein
VIDVLLPGPDDLELYDGRPIEEWVRRDPDTGETVSKTTSARYDAASGRATVETVFQASRGADPPIRTHRRDEIQFLSASELVSLLQAAGLRPQMVAGDYSMTDYAADSERLIVIAAGSDDARAVATRAGTGRANRRKGL